MLNSIPRRALAAAIALVCSAPAAEAAPIFYESFNISNSVPPIAGCDFASFPGGAGTYPFPAGWLLRNVDNNTPDATVSYVNDAWEVREDFGDSGSNCVAFSTSYYSPAGTANDWMWTPAIALPAGTFSLTWRARAYDPDYRDGYEVRIMGAGVEPTGGTGVLGNQISSSTSVFSVAAEETTWTLHAVPLTAYAGQTIHVGFRNNSNDKFLLVVDDVTVIDSSTPDLAASKSPSYTGEYARLPSGFSAGVALAVSASNVGGINLTNVLGGATIERDGAPVGSPVVSTPVASLAVGASAPLAFPAPAAFNGSGQWSVHYTVSADQSVSEVGTANNNLQSAGSSIGGIEFARYEGEAAGGLGIGAGNGGEIGASFVLTAEATFVGIRFGMLPQDANIDDGMGGTTPNPWPGLPLIANLRGFDAGKPGSLIDTTVPVLATLEGGVYDVQFVGGAHVLPAGTYVVTVSEPISAVSAALLSLPMHAQRFTLGTVWVNWPTSPVPGGWANSESFGVDFARTPEVSLLTESPIFSDGFEPAPVPGAAEGSSAAPHALRPPAHSAPRSPARKPAPTRIAAPR